MPTTIRIPVLWDQPRVSSQAGNCFRLPALRTNEDHGVWQFAKDVDGTLIGRVYLPPVINATPNAKLVLELAWNATTGVSRMQGGVNFQADNAVDWDAAITLETAQDITVPGTAYDRKKVTFPSSGNLTDTPVGGDIGVVKAFHNGLHANDTVAVNTLLEAAWIEVDV